MSKMTEKKLVELTVDNLWIDAHQGYKSNDDAFGFIGAEAYCGWFFTWPGERHRINTEDERQAVIDSLETDETERHMLEIPHKLAVEKLEAYLEERFPNLDEAE